MQKHFERELKSGDMGYAKPSINPSERDSVQQVVVTKRLSALRLIPEHLSEKRKHKAYLISTGTTQNTLGRERQTYKYKFTQAVTRVRIIMLPEKL
jgi:hypothetical protein